MDTFAGISIHSAQWDPALDLTGKKVAVIGAGCTAVQIVDACVDQVEHLTVFQRQPHWVAPRKRLTDDVPEHRRWLNAHIPYYANWNRLKSFWGAADNNYPVILRDADWAAEHLSISPANDVLLQHLPWSTSTGCSAREVNWPRRSLQTSRPTANASFAILAATTRR